MSNFGHMHVNCLTCIHVSVTCIHVSADTCQTIDMCDMFNMCFQMRKLSINTGSGHFGFGRRTLSAGFPHILCTGHYYFMTGGGSGSNDLINSNDFSCVPYHNRTLDVPTLLLVLGGNPHLPIEVRNHITSCVAVFIRESAHKL